MLTLAQRYPEFEANANQTGVQQFRLHKQGTMPNGKNVYIYIRSHAEGENLGKFVAAEVITPNIKKAGTYPLPGGKTITYPEDFEEYPGASLFGKKGWFCVNMEAAEKRFDLLVRGNEVEAEDEPETAAPAPVSNTSSRRGRPKVERDPLTLPDGEFSVKEVAEKNDVEYVEAAVFVKEQLSGNVIKKTRTERRATRGPETQLFQRI